MQRALTFAVLVVVSLVAFGCSGGLEKKIIGKYSLKVDSSKMKEEDKAGLKMAEALISGISMEIKEGGKLEMSAMGEKKQGTWKLEGTKLSITDDKGKTEVAEVKDGGETLVPDPKSMGAGDMKGAVITFAKNK